MFHMYRGQDTTRSQSLTLQNPSLQENIQVRPIERVNLKLTSTLETYL